jgi:hypothetical protein
MSKSSFSRTLPGDLPRKAMRSVLFLYLGLVLCPIHYWHFSPGDVDNAWIFALNYGAAHHQVVGRDIAWTSGPFAFLAVPMDIGNNLVQGLLFQSALWILLLIILWDLFFRGRFALRNLAFFSVLVVFSGPQYHHHPNPLGAGNLLLSGALILLVHFHLRGGMARYITALIMLGFVPMIQFVGVMLVAGVVIGIIVARILFDRSWREIVVAAVLPTLVAGVGYWISVGSWHTFLDYLRSSKELANGYSVAMSISGSRLEFLAALGSIALLALALALLASIDRRTAVFLGLIFAAPLFVSVKHAVVRQDSHIVYVFSFVALAIGLVALTITLDGRRTAAIAGITSGLVVSCLFCVVAELGLLNGAMSVTGSGALDLLSHALRFGDLRQELYAKGLESSSGDNGVEPEIKAIVQHQPIASLSVRYSNAAIEDLNLVLYPVLQRYSAYTPYLDQMNADWIRDKGPRFLIFDGKSIDGRHPWTETPAMWIEVYRWYQTRMLGTRNLLLERRPLPRFTHFEFLLREQLRSREELRIPASSQPIFWTLRCSLTKRGELRALLFRVDSVMMTVDKKSGRGGDFRIVPAVLGSPSMGNYLPDDLAEFASVLGDAREQGFSVDRLSFAGPGMSAYSPSCEVELLRPAP